jgi:hypothetical protein
MPLEPLTVSRMDIPQGAASLPYGARCGKTPAEEM